MILLSDTSASGSASSQTGEPGLPEPVLLLDDVFAELDRERQTRLPLQLLGPDERQVFVTSPRPDQLPPNLDLPVRKVEGGRILPE